MLPQTASHPMCKMFCLFIVFFIDTQNIVREKSASMSCGCVSVFHTIDFMNGEDCEDVRMRLVGARSRGWFERGEEFGTVNFEGFWVWNEIKFDEFFEDVFCRILKIMNFLKIDKYLKILPPKKIKKLNFFSQNFNQ